jgi:hypothetical protein
MQVTTCWHGIEEIRLCPSPRLVPPKIYTKILFIPFISMNYDDYNLDDDPFDACDGTRFARSGSALRAASKRNPRSLPCGTCGRPNMLTPADKHRGYQCDICARQAEQGW